MGSSSTRAKWSLISRTTAPRMSERNSIPPDNFSTLWASGSLPPLLSGTMVSLQRSSPYPSHPSSYRIMVIGHTPLEHLLILQYLSPIKYLYSDINFIIDNVVIFSLYYKLYYIILLLILQVIRGGSWFQETPWLTVWGEACSTKTLAKITRELSSRRIRSDIAAWRWTDWICKHKRGKICI